MKIFLLSDISSEHTQKWALGLAQNDIQVYIFSLNRARFDWFTGIKNVEVVFQAEEKLDGKSFFEKVNYLSVLKKMRKAVKQVQPDIVHAHYASSYGLLGALSKFHPFVISVWGSDVFDFPKQSTLHKRILKYNLKKANHIFSTSKIMAIETKKYTNKEIEITPFGIDTKVFFKFKPESVFNNDDIVVGLVKSLEQKYGIEILIKSFAAAHKKNKALKLLLVGTGSLEKKLIELVHDLGIKDEVMFTGKISHDQVPTYINMMDIFVSTSVDDSESFGVSAVEACACERAVVVSKVGGLKEVIIDGKTGICVEPLNVEQTAEAILSFAENKKMRDEFGKRAREHVLKNYNWTDNLALMVNLYSNILKS